MGISSSLFYNSNDSGKQTLHRRIRPTDEQFDEQQERWNLLAEYLATDLKDRSGYSIKTWLQGSYKFGTQIRPTLKTLEFDIDLGVYFQWNGTPEDGKYSAIEIKSLVQTSLESYKAEGVVNVVSPAKTRCSRIRFEGDFHIDVPSYHLNDQHDSRRLATEDGNWEDSDPKALYLWFKNKFSDSVRDKVRRQTRYLKCWANLKFEDVDTRPSSTLLTVLAADAFGTLSDAQTSSDDETLRLVLEEIAERLQRNSRVANPIQPNEILSDRLSPEAQASFAAELQTFIEIAKRALAAESIASAASVWTEAFEHFFPLPEIEEISESTKAAYLPALLNAPDVYVRAELKGNPLQKWTATNRIGPIPKNCHISFQVKAEAIPPGTTIDWMVRNEDHEAEQTNDLGHKAGTGLSASEDSAYKGTHYMDCELKRYGKLVALRRIPVEISGTFVRRRNLNKPAFWRTIAGKR
jgi:hypothetical protein